MTVVIIFDAYIVLKESYQVLLNCDMALLISLLQFIEYWINLFNIDIFYDTYNYKAMSSTIIPLVPSSFALRYISIMLSLCLRYTFVIPSLCLRFVNGGRSSSQRRMIEFTTKDERRTNEGTTEKEMLYQQQTL